MAIHESIERPLDEGIYGEHYEDDWDDEDDSETFGSSDSDESHIKKVFNAGYKKAQKDMLDSLGNN